MLFSSFWKRGPGTPPPPLEPPQLLYIMWRPYLEQIVKKSIMLQFVMGSPTCSPTCICTGLKGKRCKPPLGGYHLGHTHDQSFSSIQFILQPETYSFITIQ